MQYKLKINNLSVVNKCLFVDIYGEFISPEINPKFLSTPKVILYFNNGIEDRRIPLPLKIENITYLNGKCIFLGKYTYQLNHIFWKTKKKDIPCDMYINLSFADFYEEKIDIDLTPDVFQQDSKYYSIKNCGNHFVINKDQKKINRSEKNASRIRTLDSLLCYLVLLLSVFLVPVFVLEGLLTFTGVLKMPKKIETRNKLKRLISYVIYRMAYVSRVSLTMTKYKRGLFRLYYKLEKRKKVQENKITFFSARREKVTGNFEFVYNQIKDDKNLDVNFLFNTKSFRYMTNKEIKEFANMCATSKVIVLDEYTPQIHLIDLKPETKLVQLWHACGAFKTFGFTRIGKPKGSPQPTRNHRSYDYVTVSSSYCKKCHSEGFGISTDNVVPTGIARTDVFFDEKYKNKFRKKFFKHYPNLEGKKIIMFAPTFRGNLKGDAHYPMDLFDIESVCESLGDEYAIIIKHHPFVTDKHFIPEQYKDRVIDLSENTEINDLLFISDLVITDYSSLVFECSLLNLPMLFYAYDLQAYIKSRDFYFDYKLYVPGKICKDLTSLLNAIKNEDFDSEKIPQFRDMFFENLDGKSSQRIAELIYKALKE